MQPLKKAKLHLQLSNKKLQILYFEPLPQASFPKKESNRELVDFGKTDAKRAIAQQKKIQALEMQRQSSRQLEKDILSQLSELKRSDTMILLAEKNLDFRTQELQLVSDQVQQHLLLDSRKYQSKANLAEATADLTAARVNRLLILLKLEKFAGSGE